MDHMTACIMFVNTWFLFYDCGNVLFARMKNYSGLSVRPLQESSILEENVTLRQIPM
jgi:hypothetical protein